MPRIYSSVGRHHPVVCSSAAGGGGCWYGIGPPLPLSRRSHGNGRLTLYAPLLIFVRVAGDRDLLPIWSLVEQRKVITKGLSTLKQAPDEGPIVLPGEFWGGGRTSAPPFHCSPSFKT